MMDEKSRAVIKALEVDKKSLQDHIQFLFITESDIKLLTYLYKEKGKFLSGMVEKFYAYLVRFPEIKSILARHDIEKQKAIFKEYLEQLLGGKYDTEYIANRLNVGLFSAQNSIEPWMFIEAHGKVVDHLADVVETSGLNKQDFTKAMAAIFKVMLLDITFSMESYWYEKNLDLKNIKRMYAIMNNANICITRASNINDLYGKICEILVNDGAFGLAWVGHINRSAQYINHVAAYGAGKETLANVKISLDPGLPEGRDPVVAAVNERRLVSSGNIVDDAAIEQLKNIVVSQGFKSFVSVPLFLEREVISTLNLYSDKPNGITEDELRLLENIGSNVSFAIESINKMHELEKSTIIDHLTSLPNRKYAFQELKKLIGAASSDGGKKIALIMMNIDGFKDINESYGFAKADLVLKEVAKKLSTLIKMPDILGRVDVDEFMLAVYDIKQEEAVSSIIDNIDGLFTQPLEIKGEKISVSLCKGISIYPNEAENSDELIKVAEMSLKEAKKAGPNTAMLYSIDLHRKVLETLKIKKDIHKAFENSEFVLYYQPKIDISENSISGAEALIRWNHPVKGIIPPVNFIPILEETGLIVDVGEWVIRELVRQVNLWKENGKTKDIKVSFNASALQLAKNDFAERLITITNEMDTDPSLIEVEITESALMENILSIKGKLELLKSQGFGISIDDFGTGYSSLSYLQKLPIDILKIDISFIRNLLISKESVSITQAIVVLAQALGKRTIAEGVDNKQQIFLLQELGCNEVQGFYYSKPVPPPLFEKFVADFNRQTL